MCVLSTHSDLWGNMNDISLRSLVVDLFRFLWGRCLVITKGRWQCCFFSLTHFLCNNNFTDYHYFWCGECLWHNKWSRDLGFSQDQRSISRWYVDPGNIPSSESLFGTHSDHDDSDPEYEAEQHKSQSGPRPWKASDKIIIMSCLQLWLSLWILSSWNGHGPHEIMQAALEG